MKKLLQLGTVVSLVLAIVFVIPQVSEGITEDNLEILGSTTWNSTNIAEDSFIDELDRERIDSSVSSMTGFYVGGLYWVLEDVALGASYDMVNYSIEAEGETIIDGDQDSYIRNQREHNLSGPVAEVAYNLHENLDVKAGLGYYTYSEDIEWETIDDSDEYTVKEGDGLGYVLGMRMEAPVIEGFSIIGDFTYRMGSIEIDQIYDFGEEALVDVDEHFDEYDLDISGPRISLGASYSF